MVLNIFKIILQNPAIMAASRNPTTENKLCAGKCLCPRVGWGETRGWYLPDNLKKLEKDLWDLTGGTLVRNPKILDAVAYVLCESRYDKHKAASIDDPFLKTLSESCIHEKILETFKKAYAENRENFCRLQMAARDLMKNIKSKLKICRNSPIIKCLKIGRIAMCEKSSCQEKRDWAIIQKAAMDAEYLSQRMHDIYKFNCTSSLKNSDDSCYSAAASRVDYNMDKIALRQRCGEDTESASDDQESDSGSGYEEDEEDDILFDTSRYSCNCECDCDNPWICDCTCLNDCINKQWLLARAAYVKLKKDPLQCCIINYTNYALNLCETLEIIIPEEFDYIKSSIKKHIDDLVLVGRQMDDLDLIKNQIKQDVENYESISSRK